MNSVTGIAEGNTTQPLHMSSVDTRKTNPCNHAKIGSQQSSTQGKATGSPKCCPCCLQQGLRLSQPATSSIRHLALYLVMNGSYIDSSHPEVPGIAPGY